MFEIMGIAEMAHKGRKEGLCGALIHRGLTWRAGREEQRLCQHPHKREQDSYGLWMPLKDWIRRPVSTRLVAWKSIANWKVLVECLEERKQQNRQAEWGRTCFCLCELCLERIKQAGTRDVRCGPDAPFNLNDVSCSRKEAVVWWE